MFALFHQRTQICHGMTTINIDGFWMMMNWFEPLLKSQLLSFTCSLVEKYWRDYPPVWQIDPIAHAVAVAEALLSPFLLYRKAVFQLKNNRLKTRQVICGSSSGKPNLSFFSILKDPTIKVITIRITLLWLEFQVIDNLPCLWQILNQHQEPTTYPRPAVTILVATWQVWGTNVPINLRKKL